MKNKKLAVLKSVISLLLCVSMLAGTTFAWFTDGVRSGKNTIVAGNLDVELEYMTANGEWLPVTADTNVFEENTLWEPGHTEVVYLRVSNAGTLALKYQLGVNIAAESGSVNVAGEEFVLSDYIKFAAIEDVQTAFASRDAARAAVQSAQILSTGYTQEGELLAGDPADYVAFVVYMPETVGNAANYRTGELPPRIELGISLFATQTPHEPDSFGADYDWAAGFPEVDLPAGGKADVTVENGATAADVTISGGNVSAEVPAGVQVEDGTTELSLSVTEMSASGSNVTLATNEVLKPVDVHVSGVSASNTTPMKVRLDGFAAIGLNEGNLKLYHVENGETVAMTRVSSEADFSAHNQFTYDPATGNIVLYLASFSEITAVANKVNPWNGDFDYKWYDASETDFVIANADQLAAFGAIVGGMAEGFDRNPFEGKTVKLIANINLGDAEDAEYNNGVSKIFHPIGYYYNGNSSAPSSTVYSFGGTFDGNGHTIANFYQNTWEIKGDYDGNYYKDAMGLFGYVVNGTVKNLTVDRFSSDGEYTPTGVIAAYAVNSTFENIAITNCNPRVYNTGNGGIVGIGGNTDDPDTYKLTFNNITIDNSNKITALWGSWDVACGGLVGMFRGAGHVYMTNCHVAAQLDVYNDVCGNYQYYWYRYSGMLVGTNKNMVTDKDGYTVPETSKFHAEGCTVHFGDWNDYYYCEFVSNSLASYTHDHQFSRVDKSDIIFDANGNIIGCTHDHTKGGYETTDIDGDGIIDSGVLKEDKTAVYLPFNQLFTGYGWGVKHIPIYDDGTPNPFAGVTILDRTFGTGSIDKFVSAGVEKVSVGQTLKVGELFHAVEGKEADIKANTLNVFVSPVGTDSTAGGTFTIDENDWTQGKVKFTGRGAAEVTITDYYFCNPITIQINVVEAGFTYRVGNQNEVNKKTLSVMLTGKESDDVTVGVTREAMTLAESDTVKFDGLGIQNVVIDGAAYSVEVVDAINSETAADATNNNIVLLKDCGFSSLEVSSGYTLYGNGFTMTCSSDSPALDMGYSFVTLDNGTLDNVQIVCPNFDYAVLYKSNLDSMPDDRKQTTDRTRYYNVKSGVKVSGDSQILNSRISGARAAVNVTGGNCVIDNSRIEGGAVATVLVGAANSLTLRDVTLVQKPTASTYDSSKTLMGFSVLYMCDSEGKAAPTTLEGTLVQNAWVNADDKKYVPSTAQDIVDGIMKETAFIHNINGKDSLNLGFAYMPEDAQKTVDAPDNITDNRTNKETVPYEMKDVKIQIAILSTTVYVYSYKNTNGTDDEFKTESEYTPNKYGDNIVVNYSDTADGLAASKSFGTDGWAYELNVDLDKLSGYALDFSKLSMSVNSVTVTDYKVNGNAKPTSPVAVTAGGVTYTLTATANGKEHTVVFKVIGTETSKESPSKISGPTAAGFGVAKSYGGDWSGAADVLTGVKVKYWSVAENKYIEYDFSDFTVPGNAGKLNGTNSYWEYTHTNNDFTLKVTNTVAIHSGKSVYGMPIRGTDGKLYFTISSTNGYVGSGTTSRAITMQYEFTDNNGGEKLTFTHTFNISYIKDEQYSYSDLSGSGKLTKLEGSSGGTTTCLAAGTLITLQDGSKKAIENVRKGDMVMAYDHVSGKVTANKVIIVVKTQSDYYKNTFLFNDGTKLVTINEHGIFDLDLNKYVNIDKDNCRQFFGHRFVSIDSSGKLGVKKLIGVKSEFESGYKYDIVTDQTLNYVAEDTLSVTHVLVDVINTFDFGKNMMYDQNKMQTDIVKYGLYTYNEWVDYCDRAVFDQYNIPVMKVGISKGLYTKDYIIYLINYYVLDESKQIID